MKKDIDPNDMQTFYSALRNALRPVGKTDYFIVALEHNPGEKPQLSLQTTLSPEGIKFMVNWLTNEFVMKERAPDAAFVVKKEPLKGEDSDA